METNDEKLGYILAKLEAGDENRQEIRRLAENVEVRLKTVDKKLEDLTFMLRVGKYIVYALGSILLFRFKDLGYLWREFFHHGGL